MKWIVTGWDEQGTPAVLFEGEPPTVLDFGPIVTTELWVTDSTPPDTQGREDAATRPWALEPPPGGAAFRIVTFMRESETAPPAAGEPSFLEEHVTETVDFVVVLSGELTLILGDREITLYPGDSVVQRGTPHDWSNRGSEPCVVAGVLLSAQSR